MLSVVTYKWTPPSGYRSTFGPDSVNVLRRMVARHYPHPHQFFCFTDDSAGIDGEVNVQPLWNDHAHVPSPHGGRNPSCYRRLKAFAPEFAELVGPRFVSLDLDCVILNDLSPLWNRAEDFVMWGDTNPMPGSHYNGSMLLMTAGSRASVWERFDPRTSPKQSLQAGCWGSDQGWISYCLGPGEAKWTRADGVYSFRNDLKQGKLPPPPNARVVMFHGRHDPWGREASQLDWVKEHWC